MFPSLTQSKTFIVLCWLLCSTVSEMMDNRPMASFMASTSLQSNLYCSLNGLINLGLPRHSLLTRRFNELSNFTVEDISTLLCVWASERDLCRSHLCFYLGCVCFVQEQAFLSCFLPFHSNQSIYFHLSLFAFMYLLIFPVVNFLFPCSWLILSFTYDSAETCGCRHSCFVRHLLSTLCKCVISERGINGCEVSLIVVLNIVSTQCWRALVLNKFDCFDWRNTEFVQEEDDYQRGTIADASWSSCCSAHRANFLNWEP